MTYTKNTLERSFVLSFLGGGRLFGFRSIFLSLYTPAPLSHRFSIVRPRRGWFGSLSLSLSLSCFFTSHVYYLLQLAICVCRRVGADISLSLCHSLRLLLSLTISGGCSFVHNQLLYIYSFCLHNPLSFFLNIISLHVLLSSPLTTHSTLGHNYTSVLSFLYLAFSLLLC